MEFSSFDISQLPTHVNERGYVLVYVGNVHPHNNKGYAYAHRLVLEAHLGRWLETEEVVHHINEVKTDNRLQNLYLCSAEEHVQIHNRYRKNSLSKRAKIAKGVMAARSRSNQISERNRQEGAA